MLFFHQKKDIEIQLPMRWVDDYIAVAGGRKNRNNTKQHKEYISFIYIFIYIRFDLFIYLLVQRLCMYVNKNYNKNKKN